MATRTPTRYAPRNRAEVVVCLIGLGDGQIVELKVISGMGIPGYSFPIAEAPRLVRTRGFTHFAAAAEAGLDRGRRIAFRDP